MTTPARAPRVLVLLALGPALLLACEPEKPPPEKPCGGEAERCIIAGHTSAAECADDGMCLGTDVPCETHADCFFDIAEGDEIPTWDRPQGGLGTRLNARIEGFPEDIDDVHFNGEGAGLRTIITGAFQLSDPGDPSSRIACSADLCREGLGCECDTAAGFSCVELPVSGNYCAERICNQTNVAFPLDRLEGVDYHARVIPELPVRFENDFGLEDLDGRTVNLTLGLIPDDGEAAAGDAVEQTLPVVLKVGDFVEPSWWGE